MNRWIWITLLVEILINLVVIWKVSYTEIDWKAYMSEVDGFWQGDWNYNHLRGGTGPLVYPGYFLYLFGVMYQMTSSIRFAQYLFMAIYLVTLFFVLLIYNETIMPEQSTSSKLLIIAFLVFSKRIHSIFVLRLFNDGVCMLFLYASVYALIRKKWTLGCILYSIAFGIKMNAILFLPGLLVVLTLHHGIILCFIRYVSIIIATQVAIAVPFLVENPKAYLLRSFSTSRTFLMKWSVNMKFLPEDLFYSPTFGRIMLIIQLILLIIFCLKWTKFRPFSSLLGGQTLTSTEIVKILFLSNFVGIVCMKSLHYQFYVWYFHTLPLVYFTTPISNYLKITLFLSIEYAWNVYPSTVLSSLLLQFAHIIILVSQLYNQ